MFIDDSNNTVISTDQPAGFCLNDPLDVTLNGALSGMSGSLLMLGMLANSWPAGILGGAFLLGLITMDTFAVMSKSSNDDVVTDK